MSTAFRSRQWLSRKTLAIRRAAVQEQVDALEAASRIAIDRYRGGVADYLDVLTTEEDMLTAQLELGAVAGQQLIAVARLYRNLGGGWILPPEDDDEDEDEDEQPKAEAR